MKANIVSGFQDTRGNNEDFAITPYLFSVYVNKSMKIFGIGVCWGFYAIYIGIGFNVPNGKSGFQIIKR